MREFRQRRCVDAIRTSCFPARERHAGRATSSDLVRRAPKISRADGALAAQLQSWCSLYTNRRAMSMTDSVYRVTEVIGSSSESWEAAARNAVETAGAKVRDLRVAEVLRQDLIIENGTVKAFRIRLGISFKYESGT